MVPIFINNVSYKSVEHYYASMKTLDLTIMNLIINSNTPGEAKRLGSRAPLRHDWSIIRLGIMAVGVHSKFSQNHILQTKLVATSQQKLVEGNYWHDNYWGNCFCNKCSSIKGENILGEILMSVRKIFLI